MNPLAYWQRDDGSFTPIRTEIMLTRAEALDSSRVIFDPFGEIGNTVHHA